jgi:uncharacterized protein
MSRAAALAVALATALPGCPSREPAPPPQARVVLDGAAGPAAVRVELARTPEAQERGLMYRQRLDPDAGMLFVFEREAPHAFWMKNTLLPLDMLFIGDDGVVRAIVERKPLTLETDDGGVACRYVLEVNAGWAREHGVGTGARARFENVLY